MREAGVFLLLLLVKTLSFLFYRVEMRWLGEPPRDRWRHIRLAAVLNHTSLFEPIFTAGCPNHFLWRIARHGVVPIAEKTSNRALVGRFYKLIARHVISITRQRDETWEEVLARIDPDAMVVILPEGRMKRANGLDAQGRPMTVRGGVADILETIGEGRMILAYSGGLHHIQVPGQKWPRLWKTVRMNLELVDIGTYRRERLAEAAEGGAHEGFRRAVIADLERRRDRNCPPPEPSNAGE